MIKSKYYQGGQWKDPVDLYAGYNGQWKKGISKLVAKGGKWVEVFDNEGADTGAVIAVDSISYRGGTASQGDLVLTGKGLDGVVAPNPRDFAFYTLDGNFTDYFQNFSNAIPVNTDATDMVEDSLLAKGLVLKSSKQASFYLPPSQYDARGLMGNDGKRYWMMCVRGYAVNYPSTGYNYLWHTGVVGARMFLGYDSTGLLTLGWEGPTGTLSQPLGTTRWPLQSEGRGSVAVWHDAGTVYWKHYYLTVSGALAFNEGNFAVPAGAYFIAPLNTKIEFGKGVQIGSTVPSDRLILANAVGTGMTILTDALPVEHVQYSANTAVFRSALCGRAMNPNTGKYYVQIRNNNTYDLQFGFCEPGANLDNPPGLASWAVNTFAGRKFNHQTGGGTNWSTPIPANSTIGLLLDTDLGKMTISVDGVSRGDPFPAGSITVPVHFIFGGRSNTTAQPMDVHIRWHSAQWAADALSTGAAEVPPVLISTPGGDVWTNAYVKNVVVRNAPMTAGWLDSFLVPNVKQEVKWKRKDTGDVIDGTPYVVKREMNRLACIVPETLDPGNHEVWVEMAGTKSKPKLFTVDPFRAVTEGFKIDFGDTNIGEIDKRLIIAHKQWGGANGGVIKENVSWNPGGGVLILNSLGDQYTGPLRGVDRFGNRTNMSTRIGSCIVTRDYFGPASYRVNAKLPSEDGVVSAFWTFHYEEAYPGTPQYDQLLSEGLHPQGSAEAGYYLVRNHEIDIEIPTALKTDPDMEVVDYKNGRFNSWQGELRTWDLPPTDPNYWTEYTDDFINHGVQTNDGQFHEFRFDWHIHPTPKIEFYIDGVLKHTLTTTIPDIPGRFWAGLWFPSAAGNHWAGKTADFAEQAMEVRSLEIIPFADQQQYMRLIPESYPNDVYRTFLDEDGDKTYLDL